MNFIITALNEKYWNPWGISWIASLRELAQTQATLAVIDFGLAPQTKNKIKELDIVLHQAKRDSTIRNSCLNVISKLAHEFDGNFIYYDADVWFQSSIDELFEKIDDLFLMSENKNAGFIAGNSIAWKKYSTIHNITGALKDNNKTDCMLKFFQSNIQFVDNKYNCINLPDLNENKNLLQLNELTQLAIHPTGILKKIALGNNLHFFKKHKTIFEKYAFGKKIGVSRRLVKKNQSCEESENNSV